jgi:IstB-like ATP binding protein
VPIDRWHDIVGNPTLADAILDSVIHSAYKIELAGESMRKRRMLEPAIEPAPATGPGRCGTCGLRVPSCCPERPHRGFNS